MQGALVTLPTHSRLGNWQLQLYALLCPSSSLGLAGWPSLAAANAKCTRLWFCPNTRASIKEFGLLLENALTSVIELPVSCLRVTRTEEPFCDAAEPPDWRGGVSVQVKGCSMVCQQMPCSTVVCTLHNRMCCHITWHSSAIQHSTAG